MAKKKPTPSPSVEKIRIIEAEKTRRFLGACFFATVALGIIAWAAVRINDKPPWLVFALAVLSALAAPSGYLMIHARRISRLSSDLENYMDLRAREEIDQKTEEQGRLPFGESDES